MLWLLHSHWHVISNIKLEPSMVSTCLCKQFNNFCVKMTFKISQKFHMLIGMGCRVHIISKHHNLCASKFQVEYRTLIWVFYLWNFPTNEVNWSFHLLPLTAHCKAYTSIFQLSYKYLKKKDYHFIVFYFTCHLFF